MQTQKSGPLISIITPSYNQADFIEETIQSILSQDYPHKEYIIIDGGSTDETISILKKYNQQITWISEKDKGQTDAINKGFRISKGEILCWLNSDDVLLPGVITKVVECFMTNPKVKLVYGKSYFTDKNGDIIGNYPTEPFNYNRLAIFNFISQPSAFFTRDAFYSAGELDESLSYTMDYDLWIRIIKNSKAFYLAEYLSNNRLHTASKTMDDIQALPNSKETLETAFKHYGWAPANRVYGYCYQVAENVVKKYFRMSKPLTIGIAVFLSLIKYFQMNKYIRAADIKMLNWQYIKKMGLRWNEYYKTY